MKHRWADLQSTRLVLCVCALCGTLLLPYWRIDRAALDVCFVVDISGSMNAADYSQAGQPVSRLVHVRDVLQKTFARLPCGTQVSLGLFVERRTTVLFAPLDVCEHAGLLVAALASLDSRMAWAADSNIAYGLYDAFERAGEYDSQLVFLTDGHEAPPENPAYRPVFEGERGRVAGFVIGVGGPVPVPIPKFNELGQPAGFFGAEDVPQASRFGLPPLSVVGTEGYDARNAPFGRQPAQGQEHLTWVHENYLRELAQTTGLGYEWLAGQQDLYDVLQTLPRHRHTPIPTPLSKVFAGLALVLLIEAYRAGLPKPVSKAATARRMGRT